MTEQYSDEQIATWKTNRKKWVEALRSGEYEQGTTYLCKDDKHCCLGVLCRAAKIEGRSSSRGGKETVRFSGGSTLPPPDALQFVGLTNNHGSFKTDIEDSLININDDERPFSEIADIIESEPPGLFLESQESA